MGLRVGYGPLMRAICGADTNMLVLRSLVDPMQTLVNLTRAPTQASGIRFALGMQELGLRWACRFHVVCVVCVG